MNFESLEVIEGLVRSKTAVDAGMLVLLDLCERTQPSSVWATLRAFDYAEDNRVLEEWIRRLLRTEPPPIDINGFWFGLFNPLLENGETTCGLYLCGSDRFDINDSDGSWACDPEYFPEGRYASSILSSIYRTSYDESKDTGELAEFVLCLGYSCLVVSCWCQGPLKAELMNSVPSRGIVVGFDGGANILISLLTTSSA
jgi:hypothetical protein